MNEARTHAAVGVGVLAAGLVFIGGAWNIPSDAGYAGVGPNFLPWVVGLALLACGGWLVFQSLRGGFADFDDSLAAESACWAGFAWVSAAILATAALITKLGFVLTCTLCFVLAVRGFKWAQGGREMALRGWLVGAAIGACIAAPVYWMFGKLLAISLPGLTSTGWL